MADTPLGSGLSLHQFTSAPSGDATLAFHLSFHSAECVAPHDGCVEQGCPRTEHRGHPGIVQHSSPLRFWPWLLPCFCLSQWTRPIGRRLPWRLHVWIAQSSLDMSSRFASANDLLARSLFGLRQACRHAVLCPIGLPLRACALLFWFGRRTQAGLASRVVPSPSSDGGVPITHGGVPQSDSHVDNCRTVPFDLS